MTPDDKKIIMDLEADLEGESNAQRATNKILKHILIELRIANNRTGDHGDISVMKGAKSALKSLMGER